MEKVKKTVLAPFFFAGAVVYFGYIALRLTLIVIEESIHTYKRRNRKKTLI